VDHARVTAVLADGYPIATQSTTIKWYMVKATGWAPIQLPKGVRTFGIFSGDHFTQIEQTMNNYKRLPAPSTQDVGFVRKN
jgi:hypothetical protein